MGKKTINCVAVGGGNGLSMLLSGLKIFVESVDGGLPTIEHLAGIVCVSDDGGSSGRLREELRMPPPGDIRNCMVALSEDSLLLSRLFRHRFTGDGDLAGHSFGNLFLAALSEITGDFAEAVKLSSEILNSKGHLFPATNSNVRIAAHLDDGKLVRGETNIGRVGAHVSRLFLEPDDCKPMPEALQAIADADLITVGPGSLYTSLLPPLLVPGLSEAVRRSSAKKIFICNLMTQPGETDGYTSRQHFEILSRHAPELRFDHVIVNSQRISTRQAAVYEVEGAEQIGVHGSLDSTASDVSQFVYAELLDTVEKVRHNPQKLAELVLKLAS